MVVSLNGFSGAGLILLKQMVLEVELIDVEQQMLLQMSTLKG